VKSVARDYTPATNRCLGEIGRLPALTIVAAMDAIRTMLKAIAEFGRRRAVERQLAELDARTLRDIGLEAWRSPLGARVDTIRHY
jgi:uncharacterized protein YjiS (DUF1127 family)